MRRKATPPGPRGPLPDRAVGNPLCRPPADGRRPRRGHTAVGGGRSQGAEVLSDRCALSSVMFSWELHSRGGPVLAPRPSHRRPAGQCTSPALGPASRPQVCSELLQGGFAAPASVQADRHHCSRPQPRPHASRRCPFPAVSQPRVRSAAAALAASSLRRAQGPADGGSICLSVCLTVSGVLLAATQPWAQALL